MTYRGIELEQVLLVIQRVILLASVGIIGEGTEFSVGAPEKQVDTNDNAGTVESYTFDYEKISDTEPRFTQILTPILGTAANDRMGEAVVTSLTGDVIAISAPNNSGGGVEREFGSCLSKRG